MSSSASRANDRVDILGINVSAIDMADALTSIEGWIAARTPAYVCITGVHGVIESRSDAKLRQIHNSAGLVTPDGMPLVWMARRLGFPHTSRVYGPDLMRLVSRVSAERGYRQFYYGGAPGVADRLKQTLTERYPGLHVVGTFSPPFRAMTTQEDEALIERINTARPDIVWVGLSTPKQEYWMAAHAGRLDASVLVGVGAAFDFIAGVKKQAPRWMQRSGLEWLFRLASEPRRLWRRYFSIVPQFLALAARQLLTTRSARSEKSVVA